MEWRTHERSGGVTESGEVAGVIEEKWRVEGSLNL